MQCGSQATAQKHQGPPTVGVLRALALLPREWKLRGTMWSITCASIIAPGREGSQLPAQTHQGPRGCPAYGPWHYHRTRSQPRQQYLGQSNGSVSIIAPGREGSQLGGACPDMVEGCSHDPGPRSGWGMVRPAGLRRGSLSAALVSGIVRLAESTAFKPTRRHTKARRIGNAGLGTAAAAGVCRGSSIWGLALQDFDYRARS